MAFIRGVWSAYLRSFETHPLTSKSITSGVLYGAGDLLAQGISYRNTQQALIEEVNDPEEGGESTNLQTRELQAQKMRRSFFTDVWDVERTLKMCTFGLAIGPYFHHWFRILERIVPRGPTAAQLSKMTPLQVCLRVVLRVYPL
jgi:hypothetical protein